ncbi:MAG TPA: thioredoxin family protein [Anaerolineales bacterium]|nr:thioredoxin family protein [Anaerolineales bacterium]
MKTLSNSTKWILLIFVMWSLSACNANTVVVPTAAVVPTIAEPTALPTLAPTDTPAPTATPEPTLTPVPTETPVPTDTLEPTFTPVSLENPYDEHAIPQQDIEAALAKAQQDGKLVLLDFGANWCPDCLVLTFLFEDPSVQPYLQANFHVVRIDVGVWDRNLDISQQYGSPIDNGIPAVVILTADGEIIATTKDGGLANARTASPLDILEFLKAWVSLKP